MSIFTRDTPVKSEPRDITAIRPSIGQRVAEGFSSFGIKVANVFRAPGFGMTWGSLGAYNPRGAYEALSKNAEAYAALTRRCLYIANLPMICYRGAGRDGSRIDPEQEQWLREYNRIVAKPDTDSVDQDFPQVTGIQVKAQLLCDLIWCGSAFVHVRRANDGKPCGYYRLPPNRMRWDVQNRRYYHITDGGTWLFYEPGTLVAVRLLSGDEDMAFGIGAFRTVEYILSAVADSFRLLSKQAQNGSLGFIVSPGDEYAAASMKDAKVRSRVSDEIEKGMKKGTGFLVVSSNVKLSPFGVDPASMQVDKMSAIGKGQVLNATGTPPIAMGDSALNYSVASMQVRIGQESDQAICAFMCDAFYTPLLQAIAKASKVKGYTELEIGMDFAGTFASTAQRTDAINRAKQLWQFGASPADALFAEGIYNVVLTEEARFSGSGNAPQSSDTPPVPVGEGDATGSGSQG